MLTRRSLIAGALSLPVIAGAYGRAVAAGTLPPKSPCGVATTAMGGHLRGLEGVAEGLRANPIAYLEYCRSLGAGGVQHAVSTDIPAFRKRLDELEMFYEGEAELPATLDADTSNFERSIANAQALGAICVRAVSRPPANTSGRRYEGFTSAQQFAEWEANANAIVLKCLPIAERYKISIALENHKDRTAANLAAFVKKTSNEYLGVLIDPGNNMSFMETSQETVAALAPYVKACSLKDVAVAPYDQGFLMSEVLFGTGITDQLALFRQMRRHNPRVNPVTELITRDPLKVPVLTDDYYRSFPKQRARRDRWMAMVKAKATALPIVSTLSPAARFQLEEDNNRKVFEWGLTHMRGI